MILKGTIVLLKYEFDFKNNKILNTAILLCMAAAALFILIFIIALVSSGEERILKGTIISGVDVGGMTREKAEEVLVENFEIELRNKVVCISFKDKIWRIKSSDVNARLDVEKAVNDAYEITKNTSYTDKVLIEMRLKKAINNIRLSALFDSQSIWNIIKCIHDEISIEPIDAEISFKGGRFTATQDMSGMDVDIDKLYGMITVSFNPGNPENVVNVPVTSIKARRTYEMMKSVNTKLSSYRTIFSGSSNRTNNIKIGTDAVNGEVVMPGEVFSLNKAMGPRIAKSGYKEAPVIVNGEVVRGLGGGVCQVASTLYNAVLLADLDIVERKNHGLPLSYIGIGRDAAISGDYLDLKFRNNRKYPVYIRGYIYGSGVYFEIYGDNTTPNMRVEISTDVVDIIMPKSPKVIEDYSLPEGQEKVRTRPRIGYRVKSYRKTYINNVIVRSEQLGDDYYKAVTGEILVGKKPR